MHACRPGLSSRPHGRVPLQMAYSRPLHRPSPSAARLAHKFPTINQPLDSSPLCTSTGHQHSSRRSRRCQQIVASSAAASAWAIPAGFQKPDTSIDDETVPAPPALPPTPKSSSLLDVFPYLARLALSERSLYWRLALALLLMIASKVAGWALWHYVMPLSSFACHPTAPSFFVT